jgi:hypothetical protein
VDVNRLMKSVRDALTKITADLILVVMGANDIGRGRDPAWAANHDLPALLDLVFSDLPQANIIVTKPTTLRNAVYGYSAYATNVFFYSDDIPLSPGGESNRIVFDPHSPSCFLLTHNSGTYEAVER